MKIFSIWYTSGQTEAKSTKVYGVRDPVIAPLNHEMPIDHLIKLVKPDVNIVIAAPVGNGYILLSDNMRSEVLA